MDMSAMTAIELALKSTALPAAAFVLVLGLAKRPAAERHLVWSTLSFALLAMPVAHVLLPGVNVLPRLDVIGQVIAPPPSSTVDLSPTRADAATPSERTEQRSEATVSGIDVSPTAARAGGDESLPPLRERAPSAAGDFTLGRLLALGYAGVAALLLARLFAALTSIHSSVKRLRPLRHRATIAQFEDARSRLGLRRKVRLLESPSDRTPWALGLIRPVVVVPRAFSSWPQDARRNALLHELAHIARFDYATAVLGRICAALYWIQPLVWLANRRIAVEAERACDDQVLSAGAARSDYAAHLLAVASTMRGARSSSPHCAAMAGSPAVATRIAAILDADTRRATMTKPKAAFLAALAAAVIAPLTVVKSQDPAEEPAESHADFGDPVLAPLASRGPVNSEELGAAVRAYLAQSLDEPAAAVIADYLRDRASPLPGEDVPVEPASACAYCVSQLSLSRLSNPRASGRDRELDAMFTALDALEREARAAGDGDLLVRLAIALRTETPYNHDLAFSYLLAAVAVGNLSDNMKLTAAELFGQRGWYEPAKDLVQQVHDDPASSLYQSGTTQAWLRFFEASASAENELKARLVASADDTPKEYVPVFKIAPYYPEAASGAEGSVIVEFTVTEQGRTKDFEIIESSNPVFNEPTIWVAKQFRYAPRIVDGSPIAVEGVRNRITFQPPQPH